MVMRRTSGGVKIKGFTLIEVMISLFILAIGVLGAASLQLQAMKYDQVSGVRTQATYLAYSIADCMRANLASAKAGDYSILMGASAPGGTSISNLDLQVWKSMLNTQLPGGDGSIATDAQMRVTITVQWDESRLARKDETVDQVAQDKLRQFTVVTQLWN